MAYKRYLLFPKACFCHTANLNGKHFRCVLFESMALRRKRQRTGASEWWCRRTFSFVLLIFFAAVNALGSDKLYSLDSRAQAPDFTLVDLIGENHQLSEYQGKVVMINFWASWCMPCRAEMPSLERLNQSLGNQDFHILAVNVGDTRQRVVEFLSSIAPQLTFPLLIDEQSTTTRYWPVKGLPTTFIVDPKGNVSHLAIGPRKWDNAEIADLLRELQSESSSTSL